MSNKALIVGFGSIGNRHYKILSDMDEFDSVAVVSQQSNLPVDSFGSLDEAKDFAPDYVVIASETHKHHEQLKFLIENFSPKNILVEKPLFESFREIDKSSIPIFVGYNLRFHPCIKKARELIRDQEIKAVYSSCHSYLPEWRDKPYQDTYSASKARGGGVLLDLSHEIDLIMWLFGEVEIDFVKYGRFSNLSLDCEDSFLLSGTLPNKAPVELSLSYFSHISKREFHIVTSELSILIDLVTNVIRVKGLGESLVTEESMDSFEINQTYINQHKEIISSNIINTCRISEGMMVNKFIDKLICWKRN